MTEQFRTTVAPSPPPPGKGGVLPEGTRLMEYEIRRVLGRPGGFGVTYLALDTNLEHEVAIKEYLPVEFAVRTPEGSVTTRSDDDDAAFAWGRRCFLNEARVLARFRHPNVVQIHRLFEANGTAYIVMEHVRGRSLAEELRGNPIAGQAHLEALLLPLLDGLQAVHDAGVLHRDLKPENILLRDDRTPVLIDFGAARGLLGSGSRSMMSALTAGYAPVEQYSQNGNHGPWTDIYAMGGVVYRALTGRKPADAVDRLDVDPLAPLETVVERGFDPNLLRAVDWALRVSINERPQTVADWRRALTGESTVTPPAAPANPAQAPLDLDLTLEPAPRDDEVTQLLAPVPEVRAPRRAHSAGGGQKPRGLAWVAGAVVAAVLVFGARDFGDKALPVAQAVVARPAAAEVASAEPAKPTPPPASPLPLPKPQPKPLSPAQPGPAPAPASKTLAPKPPAAAAATAPVPVERTKALVAAPAKPAPAPASTPSSAGFAGMLDAHNRLRRQTGAPALSWAPANAREAQRWADKLADESCRLRFNPDAARRAQYRDNLFQAYASGPYQGWRRTSEQVVARWGEGSRLYNRNSGTCREASGGCSQYAQVVAAATHNVGCGRARCETAEVWVCTYSPPGRVQ